MSKIMVVDDEPGIVYLVSDMLRREGYEVLEAFSGTECLEKVGTEKLDLILLDIAMPDLDGWEVCRRIKKNPRTKNIKVAIFTVKSSERDKLKSLAALADLHITKPLHFKSLVKTVRALLEG